jgi:hypothetical protein
MAQLGEVEGRAGLALAMSSISPNHTPVGSGAGSPNSAPVALPSNVGTARMGRPKASLPNQCDGQSGASGRSPVSWTSRP